MKSSKKSAIIEAYGVNYKKVKDIIDGDGWGEGIRDILGFGNYEYKITSPGTIKYRPISLKGIDENNGWDLIDDEETKAVDDITYYDLYDTEDDSIIYNVKGIFNVLSLIGLPSITHIRISNNKKPIYK